MKLADYARCIGVTDHVPDLEVTSVSNDTRTLQPGALFCAISGAKNDGKQFIAEAVRKGASAVVSETPSVCSVPCLVVRDAYRAWGLLCEAEAGFPAQCMTLHAVTGTNGKTTIAFLLRKFLKDAFPEQKTGLISTIEFDCGNGAASESARTTPDAKSFQSILREMKKNGCTHVSMEMSSHGLHQHRTGSAKFGSGVFTNLTGDHLDYHGTMENYYQAKKLLFSELCKDDAPKIINIDDLWGARLAREITGNTASLSASDRHARIFLHDIQLDPAFSAFAMDLDGKKLSFRTELIGLHNVFNFAEAAAEAILCGAEPEAVLESAKTPFAVPGRLEKIMLDNGASAFVDYAHTDDALSRVLDALRVLPHNRLFCVFGCGGDRDRTKRPRMGRAAAEKADVLYVTSDNPRTEDPDFILSGILPGIPTGKEKYVIRDRREAICRAVKDSRRGDIILVAGKGHENYQEINGVRHHFDDREILREFCGKTVSRR